MDLYTVTQRCNPLFLFYFSFYFSLETCFGSQERYPSSIEKSSFSFDPRCGILQKTYYIILYYIIFYYIIGDYIILYYIILYYIILYYIILYYIILYYIILYYIILYYIILYYIIYYIIY